MGSEQVAQVLRQCGNTVKLVVTRGPVEEIPSVSAVMPVVLPTVTEQQVREFILVVILKGVNRNKCLYQVICTSFQSDLVK